jgi:hypothetical protein
VFHRNQFSNLGVLVFCASLLLGIVASRFTNAAGPIIAGALVGAYFLFATRSSTNGRRWPCFVWGGIAVCAAPVLS